MSQKIRLVEAAQNKQNPWPIRIACAFAVLYLISPIDFIPDVVPLIGWLDDFVVVFGVIMWIIQQRRSLPTQA